MIYFDYRYERRLWVRLFLRVKRALGFRMLFGEIAVIAGPGPCQRCVGASVNGPNFGSAGGRAEDPDYSTGSQKDRRIVGAGPQEPQ